MNKQLENYAYILVHYGIQIKKGEKLYIKFDENGMALAKLIAAEAYRLGASDVQYQYKDADIEAARIQYGSDESLSTFPQFLADFEMATYKEDYHSIFLRPYKGSSKDLDAEKSAIYSQHRARCMSAAKAIGMSNQVKWVLAPVATQEWAEKIYPDDSSSHALEQLWQDLLYICRANATDSGERWEIHNRHLKTVAKTLNDHQFEMIRYESAKTHLEIALIDQHIWTGGENQTKDGKPFISNIPTEEIYTMPDYRRVNGYMQITKPWVLYGHVIHDLRLEFSSGIVTKAQSSDGQQIVESFLKTDEGAKRLGEVALVDSSSPAASFGHPFFDSLIDENAACHIALGRAYEENVNLDASPENTIGFNLSSVHEDLMIGSDDMKVVGIKKDQSEVVIMENGRFL